MKLSAQTKAMLQSWARSFVAAALALYTAGETDPGVLLNAGLAAVVPVAIRYFNKKDPAFGLVAQVAVSKLEEELPKLLKKSTAKKATTTKKK